MPQRKRKRLLIVEDDIAIARGLLALLEGEGYGVDSVADGKKALARILQWKPDVVLLDVNIPGLSGPEVCRQARGKGFHNPVIMVSAQRDPADKVLGLEAGADDYVTKPFDPRELVARVRAQVRAAERKGAAGGTGEGGQRRLVAVMFADMKGYSRAMQRSETAALKALEHCRAVMNREIRRGRGTTVEVVGDGYFVTFGSAVAAVQTALRIHQSLSRPSRGGSDDEPVLVRIGIHLGEIVTFQGKPKGDAVNIAARIQDLARPGGILVSEVIRDALVGKVALRMTSRGSRKLKNIRQPVRLFAVSTEPER
jgi:DNA-binding response OmpR family regulator